MKRFLLLLTLLPAVLTAGCNCVAFKVNGIQDWWLNSVQTGILNEFKTNRDPVSVGVIGGSTSIGNDQTIVQYLRDALATSAWKVEIANNGKNYENFQGQSLNSQKSLLIDSNSNIRNVLSVTPKVFMPPMDTFDANTLSALTSLNFTVISAAAWSDLPPYPLSGQTLFRFPESASMDTNGVIQNNVTVFNQITSQLDSYGFSVVGVDMQYFAKKTAGNPTNSVENSAIGQLRAVISKVKAAGIRIVTISEIPSNVQSSSVTSRTSASSPATSGTPATSRTSAASSGTPATSRSASSAPATSRTSASTPATSRTSASTPASSTPATSRSASSAPATSRSASSAPATSRTSASTPATSGPAVPSAGVVCFRLDDIQDYWITAAQQEVIRRFRQENVPLSIGIISNTFGQDDDMVDFVRNTIGTSPKIEIVSHGYNHEDFTQFSLNSQLDLLTKSKNQIKTVTGVDVDVFIPPYNAVNENTFTALKQAKFRVVSSEVEQDPAPYAFSQKGIYRYPIQAATANQVGEDLYGIPASQTMQQIRSQIASFGFSVVMLHPQEFSNMLPDKSYENSVNSTQIAQLSLLLQTVKNNGYTTVVLGDLPTAAPQ